MKNKTGTVKKPRKHLENEIRLLRHWDLMNERNRRVCLQNIILLLSDEQLEIFVRYLF